MLLAIWPRWFWDRIGWVVQGYLQSWTIQSGCVNSYLGDIPTYFATLHTGLPLSTGPASTKQVLFWSYVPSAGFTHKSGTNCRTVFTVQRQTPCVPRSINCSSTNHCLDLRYCCRLFDSESNFFSRSDNVSAPKVLLLCFDVRLSVNPKFGWVARRGRSGSHLPQLPFRTVHETFTSYGSRQLTPLSRVLL